MLTELLEIGALMTVLVVPFLFGYKRNPKAIKIPRNYPDTSDAHYAINEHGFLEEIQPKKLSSHTD